MSFKFYALLLALLPSIQAIKVANLNVSESIPSKYDCDSTCYKDFQEGLSVDAASYSAIYDTTSTKPPITFPARSPAIVSN
jgi:hypothetical protein